MSRNIREKVREIFYYKNGNLFWKEKPYKATKVNITKPAGSINIGVSFNKQSNRWKASICVDNKSIFLGYFNTISNAILARKNAEVKYRGECRNE